MEAREVSILYSGHLRFHANNLLIIISSKIIRLKSKRTFSKYQSLGHSHYVSTLLKFSSFKDFPEKFPKLSVGGIKLKQCPYTLLRFY